MNEHYLEWLFLREHIGYWVDQKSCNENLISYRIQDKEYDIEKMKARYIKLTKMLLKDYELDKEE